MDVDCEYSKDQNDCKCNVTAIFIVKPETALKTFKDENNTLGKLSVSKQFTDYESHNLAHTYTYFDYVPATLADVTQLHIEQQTVRFFPRNIEKTFRCLTRLDITSCGLTMILRKDLEGLGSLKYLDLCRNKLTILPDDLFSDMRNLEKVYINNNQLRFLTSMLLKPIGNTVTYVDLRNNVRIDDFFDKNNFSQSNLRAFLETIDKNCLPPGIKTNQKSAAFVALQANFEKFRISRKYSDYTIKIRGKDFDVHKCVLAAQSSVFDEMFSKDSAEVEQAFMNVKNFSNKAFESFLNYFYTGRVDAGVTPVEMIQLASEFDVPELKTKCIDKILENLSETNALEIFNLGHDHASDELIKMAFKFIKKIYPLLKDDLENDRKGLNSFINIGEHVESWDQSEY